jgi:CDP-6-deoxy-D-xylo-4-hexulose-3-dehydrase
MLFGGNLVRQPVFASASRTGAPRLRVVGDLAGADTIMNDSLFVGVYPGLSPAMCDHIADTIRSTLDLRASPDKRGGIA